MNPMNPMKNEHKTIQTNFSQTMKAKEKEKILKTTSDNQLMTQRAIDTINDGLLI